MDGGLFVLSVNYGPQQFERSNWKAEKLIGFSLSFLDMCVNGKLYFNLYFTKWKPLFKVK